MEHSITAEEMITIPKIRFDELEACEDLLEQMIDDQNGMLDIYRGLYPQLVEAAGYVLSEEDEEVSI
jgi:hypothetical protein